MDEGMKGKPMKKLTILAVSCAAIAAATTAMAQTEQQLRQLETQRAMLVKNLATSEGWLASARSRYEAAKKNTRTEPVYSTRWVERPVRFANGTERMRKVEEKYQSGTKTIQDPNLEKYARDVAAYEGQVANGKAQLAALDAQIQNARQAVNDARAAAHVVAAAPAPAAPTPQPIMVEETLTEKTEFDKPPQMIAESAPLWKNPFAWLGGVVVLYLVWKFVLGGAA